MVDGRNVGVTLQTVPMDLTSTSACGDMHITLPFLIMTGNADFVIVGTKTLRENLDIDVMRQLKERLLREEGGDMLDLVPERVQVWERGTQLRTRQRVQVLGATLPGAAEHTAGGSDEPDDGTVAMVRHEPSNYGPPDV